MFKSNPTSVPNFISILAYGIMLSVLIFEVELSTLSSKSTRSGYGEPCNKTFRCNSQLWLACDRETSTCQCAKPDEMIYDNTKQKCIVMIGERCKYGFDEDEIPTALWYEKADCVKDAVCGPSGRCSCPDGFYEDEELQQCSTAKDHGLSCRNSNECNKDKLLSCFDGKCQCDPDKAIYNLNSYYTYPRNYGYQQNSVTVPINICVGRVGSRCNDRFDGDKLYCIQYAFCGSGTCQCENKYIETSDQLCGSDHHMDCSKGQVCSDKLQCTGRYLELLGRTENFLCECPHPEYQKYDKRACEGLIGAPCDPLDVNRTCIKNSVCIERDNMFRCECGENFVENELGMCEIAFGKQCSNSVAINCDTIAHLQCKNSTCVCENNVDIYEHQRRQCSRPVGVRCKMDEDCISNSICLKSNIKLWGRCTCKGGYSVTKNHICILEDLIELNQSDEVDVNTPSMITNEGSGQLATVTDEAV